MRYVPDEFAIYSITPGSRRRVTPWHPDRELNYIARDAMIMAARANQTGEAFVVLKRVT